MTPPLPTSIAPGSAPQAPGPANQGASEEALPATPSAEPEGLKPGAPDPTESEAALRLGSAGTESASSQPAAIGTAPLPVERPGPGRRGWSAPPADRLLRGALASVGLHALVLGLLSLWVIPHLRKPAEARSAHLETTWTRALRSEAPTLEPAPELIAPEDPVQLPAETWEPPPPSLRPMSAPDNSRRLSVTAAQEFRTFTPTPKAKPAARKPVTPAPKPPRKKPAQRPRAQRTAPIRQRVRTKSPVLKAPRVRKRPTLQQPSRCRRRGHSGSVRLLLEVNQEGKVETSRVLSSAGCESLDRTARLAGLRYQFHPGTKDGRPSRWFVQVEIQFGSRS